MASDPNVSSLNYCPSCGGQLEDRYLEGRSRAYCSNCEQPVYRNAKPCAGVLVVDDSELLLVQRSNPPAVGSWSLPAGYLEIDESPATAAVRELHEETGISVQKADITLFDTKLTKLEDGTHVLVLIYTTARKNTTGSITPGSDAMAARFWDIDVLLESGHSLEPGYEELFRQAIRN